MSGKLSIISRFWRELKRRNVLRSLAVYAGSAYIIFEASTLIFPRWGLPEWAIDIVLYLLILGAGITFTVSWIFDVRSEGVVKTSSSEEEPEIRKKTASHSWRIATYLSLFVIVALIVFNVFSRNRFSKVLSGMEKSIAVLPFENLIHDSSEFWFTDGISDVIINQLTKISGLRVISRTSTSKYKEEKKTIPEIGEELGVNYIIEGTVQKQGDQMRIVVQLVRVKNEAQLWSDLYDNQWGEIFDIQTDIAKKIAANLQTVLSPEETKHIEDLGTQNPEAYNLFLKGNHLMTQWNTDAFHRAIENYQQAIALDSSFAEAYAGVARATVELTSWDVPEPDPELVPVAMNWALKALELDENLGEAYYIIGFIKTNHEWDWTGAEEAYKKGIKLNPSFVWGRIAYGNFLTLMKRFDESITLCEKTIELNPLDPGVYIELGYPMWLKGQDEEALELYYKSLELDPDFANANALVVQYYAYKGIYNQFVADYCENVLKMNNNDLKRIPSGQLSFLGTIYTKVGRPDEADAILDELNRRIETGEEISYEGLGYLYNALGNYEKALDYFEMSYNAKEPFIYTIYSYWDLDSIQSNKRFIELTRKLGFER